MHQLFYKNILIVCEKLVNNARKKVDIKKHRSKMSERFNTKRQHTEETKERENEMIE